MKKYAVLGTACIFSIGIILFGFSYQKRLLQVNNKRIISNEYPQSIQQLDLDLQALYFDESRVYLATNLKEKELEKFNKQVTALEDSLQKDTSEKKITTEQLEIIQKDFLKVKNAAEDVNKKYEIQNKINLLFEYGKDKDGKIQLALNGPIMNKELPIGKEVTTKKVTELKEKYYKKNITKDAQSMWQVSINVLLDAAEIQTKDIEEITSEITELEKSEQVDQQAFDQLKARIEKVKNLSIKKDFLARLDKLTAKITMATSSSERKQQEENNSSTYAQESYEPPQLPNNNNQGESQQSSSTFEAPASTNSNTDGGETESSEEQKVEVDSTSSEEIDDSEVLPE